ncbi:MAG TPA: GNAT family N-acetyltransferase [Vicinamibacterales bacterium]|nr:GNAT family N-acetyltransferase [Vicinamibacterales bacterium]
MPEARLVTAASDSAILRQIYDETWAIWSDGLTRANYERYNRAQMSTAWGAGHLDRVALVDGERLLASAKRYRLTLASRGAEVSCLGIGAVFTPPESRGHGYGAAIVELMIEEAAREWAACALLFSEIDPGFYARLGFEPIPIAEAEITLRTQPREGAPAVLMRGGDDKDIDNIAAMHAARASNYPFALRRSPEYIRFAISKRRLLAASGEPGARHVEYFVTEEGGNAVAYIVITRGPEGHVLEEWGDRDPTGARVGAMLQVLAARTPTEAAPRLRTWLPLDFAPPQIERVAERPAAEQAMIRGIARATPRLAPEEVFYLKADAF